jgi:branched-chain amino acid transport system ATP-binding protein
LYTYLPHRGPHKRVGLRVALLRRRNSVECVIGELKQSGIAILLAEQNLAMALSVADRCYVLNKGQVVTETTAAALKADEQVKHHFLGV